jgi:benzoyl-CoA reductase subunit C
LKTRLQSEAFAEIAQATTTVLNSAAKKWREEGGKVVGYFCSFAPEEIITAAGLLPIRIRGTGSEGTEYSDAYMTSLNCSFSRNCLNLALKGDYDFLEGLVGFNTCDHTRRVYDIWTRKVEVPFVQLLSIPRKTGEEQVEWYRDELANLRQGLGEHFGVEITDARLWDAIRLHNETRRLQRRLYDLRKAKIPPISGAEMLAITVAGTAMPKERYNGLLREVLDEIEGLDGIADCRPRLLIMGGELDDPEYVEMIEDLGGLVVADSLCFGSRILWKDVAEGTGDPLLALARYHVAERPACPRMFGVFPRRLEFVRELIREFRVDGVISQRLQFCDYWGYENSLLNKEFKEGKIPFLMLDREYSLGSGIGQTKTRIQAFLETLEVGE